MRFYAVVALSCAAGSALAAGESGDVGLLFDGNSITTVRAADDVGDSADAFVNDGQRVFETELNNLGFADEPGFYTNSTGGFTPGQFIGYRNIGTLKVWNGADFDQDAATSLNQIVGPMIKSTPAGNVTEEGFRFQYNGGEYDEHPDLQLADTSTAGVFLWELDFFVSDSATGSTILGESQRIFIVINFGIDDVEFERAVEYAESVVPAPGAAGVLALAGLVAARRRR